MIGEADNSEQNSPHSLQERWFAHKYPDRVPVNSLAAFLFYAILTFCIIMSIYLRIFAPPPPPQHSHHTSPLNSPI